MASSVNIYVTQHNGNQSVYGNGLAPFFFPLLYIYIYIYMCVCVCLPKYGF